MALAEDASAPPAIKFTGASIPISTLTTASFNPPANSLILVVLCSDARSFAGSGMNVTDSIGGTFITRTRQMGTSTGYGSIHTQYLYAAHTGYTITVTINNAQMTGTKSNGYIFKFYVITGAADVQTGPNGGAANTPTTLSATFTPTTLGSYIYGSGIYWNSTTLLTPQSGCTTVDSQTYATNPKSWQIYRTTNPTSSLTSQTFGFTDNVFGAMTAYEVIPIASSPLGWTSS